ncbi:MAG: tetratricopeptide repeat protein, partial [Bradymonadaceae bacterium]
GMASVLCALCLFISLFISLPVLAESTGSEETESAAVPPPAECRTYVAPHQKTDVTALTLLGVACFEAGDYPQALHFYLAALEISDPIMLRAAIGRALHELGIYSAAKFFYEDYLTHAGDVDGAQRIRERLRTLEKEIEEEGGSFYVTAIPPQATVYLVLDNGDWFELGTGSAEASLKSGKYQIQIRHPDYYPHQIDLNLREGTSQREVDVELVPSSATFDVTARQWRRAGAWTMGASTPLLIGGLTLLAASAQTSKSVSEIDLDDADRDTRDGLLLERQQRHDRADRLQFWGITGTAVGATGMLIGAVFYVSGRKSVSTDDEAVSLEGDGHSRRTAAPWIGPGQVGVTVSW